MLAPLIIFLVNLARRWRNLWRRVRRRRVDFVRVRLSGPLPELAAPVPWWRRRLLGARAPLSAQGLRRILERVADDPQARGVVLHIEGLQGGWATLQGAREEILRFRAAGGRAVAYLVTPDVAGYYLACACDRIVLPPTVFFGAVGLRAEVQFLRDALARLGVSAEVTAVSPYKSGGDTFARSDISPEARAQLERLLDLRYAELLRAIGEGRGMMVEAASAIIDGAPYAPGDALARGLADALLYEDELAQYLAAEDGHEAAVRSQHAATLLDWPQAERALRLPLAARRRGGVALVAVEGTIAGGASRSLPIPIPLLGGRAAGSDSVTQALRRAERSRQVKAVVLFVNSPGGAVLASDLIWREVLRLRRKKPVVVCMGDAAASGGYYISAPASLIVARPATVTGSIGVFMLRPVLSGALERAGVNSVALGRGANSGFLDASEPPSEAERAAVRAMVFGFYEDFKARVREGRGLPEERLEPVAGGRVWLGEEALARGLVDRLGGLPESLEAAQELAGLPRDRRAPLLLLGGGGPQLPPEPFHAAPAALGDALHELLRPQVWAIMPFDMV